MNNVSGVGRRGSEHACGPHRGHWISPENTTSAEGDSTPVGDTALSMLRLLAAVPSPCEACQPSEAGAEQK
jgi:hypothetical protein